MHMLRFCFCCSQRRPVAEASGRGSSAAPSADAHSQPTTTTAEDMRISSVSGGRASPPAPLAPATAAAAQQSSQDVLEKLNSAPLWDAVAPTLKPLTSSNGNSSSAAAATTATGDSMASSTTSPKRGLLFRGAFARKRGKGATAAVSSLPVVRENGVEESAAATRLRPTSNSDENGKTKKTLNRARGSMINLFEME